MITRIDTDKRIWIDDLRFDSFTTPEFLNEERDDDEWKIKVAESDYKAFDIVAPTGDFAGFTIRTEFNQQIISAGVGFRIDEDRETIAILDDGGVLLCGLSIKDRYVVINRKLTDDDAIKYDICVEIFGVPYDIMSHNINPFLKAVNYPFTWSVYNPNIEENFIVVAMNAVDPPKTMICVGRIRYCDFVEGRASDYMSECLTKLYTTQFDRFGKFPYGIVKQAVIMLDTKTTNKAAFFDVNADDIKPYMIKDINGCPQDDGTIELIPLTNTSRSNSPIKMNFKKFFFGFRGVFSMNSAVIAGSKLILCMDGITITRNISKTLMSLIDKLINSTDVHEPMDDDLSDAVRDYILKHYSPRKMIDQIIICNKSRGIITCNIEHDDMQLADNTLEEVNNE